VEEGYFYQYYPMSRGALTIGLQSIRNSSLSFSVIIVWVTNNFYIGTFRICSHVLILFT